MNDASSGENADADEIDRDQSRPWRPQVSLLTLLLVMTVAAVWIAVRKARQETEIIQSQLPALRAFSRELVIEDSSKFNAVQRRPVWYDENIWDVYLPEPPSGLPSSYRVFLGLDEIGSRDMPQSPQTTILAPGEHVIEFQYKHATENITATVSVDGDPILKATKPKDWEPGHGYSGGSALATSSQYAIDKPLVLLRRRFSMDKTKGQSDVRPGVVVWIERIDPKESAR